MNIRPIVLLLALMSAVVIGCSAAPTPVPTPIPAPSPNFTEEEVIALAKSWEKRGSAGPKDCFGGKGLLQGYVKGVIESYVTKPHASYKPNGIWLIRVHNSYTVQGVARERECTYRLDDSTGEVLSP